MTTSTMKPLQADIHVIGRNIFTIYGITNEGKEWIEGNIQGENKHPVYSDSQNYVMDIVEGAINDKLLVTMTTQGGHYGQISFNENNDDFEFTLQISMKRKEQQL